MAVQLIRLTSRTNSLDKSKMTMDNAEPSLFLGDTKIRLFPKSQAFFLFFSKDDRFYNQMRLSDSLKLKKQKRA